MECAADRQMVDSFESELNDQAVRFGVPRMGGGKKSMEFLIRGLTLVCAKGTYAAQQKRERSGDSV
jgi:hypothetical protein